MPEICQSVDKRKRYEALQPIKHPTYPILTDITTTLPRHHYQTMFRCAIFCFTAALCETPVSSRPAIHLGMGQNRYNWQRVILYCTCIMFRFYAITRFKVLGTLVLPHPCIQLNNIINFMQPIEKQTIHLLLTTAPD